MRDARLLLMHMSDRFARLLKDSYDLSTRQTLRIQNIDQLAPFRKKKEYRKRTKENPPREPRHSSVSMRNSTAPPLVAADDAPLTYSMIFGCPDNFFYSAILLLDRDSIARLLTSNEISLFASGAFSRSAMMRWGGKKASIRLIAARVRSRFTFRAYSWPVDTSWTA